MKTTSTRDRDDLKAIEAKVRDLRDKRASAVKERDDARKAFATGGDKLDENSREYKEALGAVARLGVIDDDLERATDNQIGILKKMGGDESVRDPDAMRGGSPPIPASKAWDSRALLENDEARVQLAMMASSTMPGGRVHLGRLSDRDKFAADVSGTANMRRGTYAGVVPQLRRQLRILDLIPTGTMDGNSVPYTQESGSITTAVETAEGAVKPEAAVTYTDQDAFAKTIAHWTKIRKQVLSDFPAMATIIESRLRYGVERRLQDEILAGDGLGENIRGILNTTGIGSIAYSASELITDQILDGITQIFLADGEANAIVMHPSDWKTALKAKAAGDGHYYSDGPFSVTPAVMWGVSLIPSASIPLGRALVGDFAIGASLFIREGVNLLLADSDQDDFTRNKVTLLAELRAALAVWNPSVFTVVNLAP